MEFYRTSIAHLIDLLKTDKARGLSTNEAKKRLHIEGHNTLPGRLPDNFSKIFFKQLNNAFSYLLIAAALLKLFVEGYRDAIIICIIIVVNALVSALQEGRASQTLAKLQTFLKTDCLVVRDGNPQTIDQTLLVPGDIILLHEGMKVPADARLFEGHQLQVDEAMLTGESIPVIKSTIEIVKEGLPLTQQNNMVFTGSTILSGHAHAIVVATGKKAEIGHMTCALDDLETDMPLKKDLIHLSDFLLRAVIGIIIAFLFVGFLREKNFAELIFTMTSLLVSIVPEGIPIVSTILMARSAYRMARSNVLVKRLQAIDGLGRLQVLVVDKTGTLTKNEQVVSTLIVGKQRYTVTGDGYEKEGEVLQANGKPVVMGAEPALGYAALAATLLNDAEIIRDEHTQKMRVRGEPLQAALGICAEKMGFESHREQEKYPKIDEVSFAAETPIRKVLFDLKGNGGEHLFVAMGSPERVEIAYPDAETPRAPLLGQLLEEGLRVIAIAYGITRAAKIEDVLPTEIQSVSFWGLHDAIRPGAIEGIKAVQELGVRVIVATGDHLQTAIHVARATGIYRGPGSVQEGVTLDDTNKHQVTVMARVTSQEKREIIKKLHEKNILVGMTGDGVNDVPALITADVGIALGTSGTDVAKEAASIVLLDDSLNSIAEGIMLGRHAFLTMRHVLTFVLATSASEIVAFALALIVNVPLPLLATQILWVHMLTDGLLTIALGMEPVNKKIVRTPLKPRAHLIDHGTIRAFFLTSIPVAAITLLLFILTLPEGIIKARSMALTVLAMGQWWNAWNMRSETESVFTLNPFSNIWLLVCTILVIVSQIGALYLPILQTVLYTTPLTSAEFMLCIGASSLVLLIEEIRKWWYHA